MPPPDRHPPKRRAQLLSAPLLAALTAGCANVTASGDEDSSTNKIIGGQAEDSYPAVVGLARNSVYCTGALIAPRVVLTAAHCINYTDYTPPLEIRIHSGATLTELVEVEDWLMHPEWSKGLDDGVDVALLYLSRAARATPLLLNRAEERAMIGRAAKIVGYGRTNDADINSAGLKYSVDLSVTGMRGDLYILDSADETLRSACRGDSGGPMLVDGKVAGVASFVDSNGHGLACVDRSYYTSLPSLLDWIDLNLSAPTYGRRSLFDNLYDARAPAPSAPPAEPTPPSEPAPPAEPTPEQDPAEACHTLALCLNACDGDAPCRQECVTVTNNEIVDRYNALVGCKLISSCATDECLQQSCGEQLRACGFEELGG